MVGWLRKQLRIKRMGHVRFETIDEWHTNPQGHKPGAFDCPCRPFVTTNPDTQTRTIRHIPMTEESETLEP